MGLNSSNKVISTDVIDCAGTLKVTLALSASPDITSTPTDIVLILDRSGSMAGSPLDNLKSGAKKFIDIIDEATDSSQDGQIGSGSRIGIVSFATNAVQDTQLITSVDELKAAVDSLAAGGFTNHADAFAKANALFDPNSTNAKVMVMFTDGKTTAGPDPNPVAAAARADGIIIYGIGLIGANGIDPAVLDEWATDPSETHVAITPDDADLEDLFEDLAENISKPGATNIEITETVNPDFVITSMQLDVNLKNVCPRKRVALAIALSEDDQQGNEYQSGTKTLTIPAHFSTSCRDVLVKCVKFILPEDLGVSGGSTTAMCNTRNFKALVFAHNIDSDFYCCNNVTF